MRITVFSDIHGNGPAFRAALPLITETGADAYLFLGDLCGYYPDVDEILNELQRLPNLRALLGNHDEIYLKILAGDRDLRSVYASKYGGALNSLCDSYGADKVGAWLSRLSGSFYGAQFKYLAVHGSPSDVLNGRLYDSGSCAMAMKNVPPDCETVFFGHTHYPLEIEVDGCRFINPGSIGQPRHGGRPSFYVFETDTKSGFHVPFDYPRDEYDAQLKLRSDVGEYAMRVLWRY